MVKKNVLIVFSCAVVMMFSGSAYGAQGPYFSGSLGVALLGDTDAAFPEVDEYLSDFQEFAEFLGGSFEGCYGYNVESKVGFGLNGAIGYDFGNNFRFEAEISYQKNDVDKAHYRQFSEGEIEMGGTLHSLDADNEGTDPVSGDTSSFAFLVNGYYDFANESAFTPFLGAGIGLAKVEYNYSSEFLTRLLIEDIDENGNFVGALDESGDTTVLAYQLGAGVGYAVSETFTLEFKYRFFATEDPEFGDVNIEYTNHNFYVGFRKGF